MMLENTRKFFYEDVLHFNPVKDELGDVNWGLLLSVAASWVIVYLCIRKGTEQTGKVAIVTVILPYILLIVFLLRFDRITQGEHA